MKRIKVLLYYGKTVREYDASETSGEPFIHLKKSEYNIHRDITLPISLENGTWVINSHSNVEFYYVEDKQNKLVNHMVKPGTFVKAVINETTEIYLLFIALSSEYFEFQKYTLVPGRELSIGSSSDSDFCFKYHGVSKLHARIGMNAQGKVVVDCLKSRHLFINGASVEMGKYPVNYPDVIDIMGLKILILSDGFLINNPEGKLITKVSSDELNIIVRKVAENVGKETIIRTPRMLRHFILDPVEIEAPPAPVMSRNLPLLLMIGPSMTMGLAMLVSMGIGIYNASSGNGNPSAIATSAVMAVSMLIGAIAWPIASTRYQKKIAQKDEENRVQRYTKYIEEKAAKLETGNRWNTERLLEMYPEPQKIISRVVGRSRKLWERSAQDEDFMSVRIGLGTQTNIIPILIPKDNLALFDDPLRDKPKEVYTAHSNIPNLPITIPLKTDGVIGIIGKGKRNSIVQNIIVQLAGLHSYDELKMVFICNDFQKDQFSWVKDLPHFWSADRLVRFYATTSDEAHDVLTYIGEVARARDEALREERRDVAHLPHYVIIIMDTAMVEDEPALQYISDSKNQMSFSSIFVGSGMKVLPSDCQTIVNCSADQSVIFSKQRKELGELVFVADEITSKEIQMFSTGISKYQIRNMGGDQRIPASLDFLSMFRVGNVSQLGVRQRWTENAPNRSLAAPIGVKTGGELFSLNIHEKDHGAHGLIAGMTGSGKSEFIQSYILSMAVNFHPHDVSFILIDYKGGGMANCFKGLPHISGVITNLGGNQINRSLASLNAELKRRQRVFEAAGVNNINSYEVLYKENKRSGFALNNFAIEPLPHLLIISDEFAELKRQQPEFMEKLVSAACIGRSLGVHLILATQKPSGVVDDQIWSNSRFRVCLKVLDRNDSQEMIKRPEAASIAFAGRAFVQVGYNEIFECVQTGYSGARYIEEPEYIDPEAQNVLMINNSAKPLKAHSLRKIDNIDELPTQLDAVLKHLKDIASEEQLHPIKIWKEPMEELLALESIAEYRETVFDGTQWNVEAPWMSPVVGMIDDPERQRQYPLKLDIGKEGHVIIYGMPGTGKTTFLQTLIYSIAASNSPEDASFYILDFGGRTLGVFSELPHCMGIAYSESEDRVEGILESVTEELEYRKNSFASCDCGNIEAFRRTTGEKIPALTLVLDSYSAFRERFGKFEDALVTIAREGANFGIYLVITGSDPGAVYYKIADYSKQMLTLQMVDKSAYMSVVGQTFGVEPEAYKGRGLIKQGVPLEFQTALATGSIDDAERTKKVKEAIQAMNAVWLPSAANRVKTNATKVPAPTQKVTTEPKQATIPRSGMRNMNMSFKIEALEAAISEDFLPVGWNTKSAEIEGIDLTSTVAFYVGGGAQTGKTTAVIKLLQLASRLKDSRILLFDGDKVLKEQYNRICGLENYSESGSEFDSLFQALLPEIDARIAARSDFREQNIESVSDYEHMQQFGKIFIFIDGFKAFFDEISDDTVKQINARFRKGMEHLNVFFIIAERPELLTPYNAQDLYYYLLKSKAAILLGGNVAQQTVVSFDTMNSKERQTILPPGSGYMWNLHQHVTVKMPEIE